MPASSLGVTLDRLPTLRAATEPPPPTAELAYPQVERVDVRFNERLNKFSATVVLLVVFIDVTYAIMELEL